MESTSTSGKIARSVHRRARARTRAEKNLLFEFFNERNPLPCLYLLRNKPMYFNKQPLPVLRVSTTTRAGR